jgi:hypothetical protein
MSSGGLLSRLATEIRTWRWTWIGVLLAVVMPLLYLWGDSPQYALVALMLGVAMALAARGSFDRTDE